MQTWRWSHLHTGKWPKFHWFHWHQAASKIFVSFALCFCEKCQPKKLRNESRKMLKDTVKLRQNVPIHAMSQCSNRHTGGSLGLSSIYLKVHVSPCKWWYLSKSSTWCFWALHKISSILYIMFSRSWTYQCAVASLLSLVPCLCCQSWEVVTVTMHHPCSASLCPLAHIALAPWCFIPSQTAVRFVQNYSERHIS